jgi:hypothetical protein
MDSSKAIVQDAILAVGSVACSRDFHRLQRTGTGRDVGFLPPFAPTGKDSASDDPKRDNNSPHGLVCRACAHSI